ncbi:hypothetical protein K474DRAFT_1658593 [Panus rudis PR-1116 ss-1]|nr:hypothetical protein K474DRAFT_1658593 [Panus rudis PR-1116 ss-1]
MSSYAVPLKLARLVSLALSFVFGIVGMSLGIDALAKSNDSKDLVRQNAPPGVTVNIDTDDAFSSGTVVTVVCGLIALTSIVFLPLVALSKPVSTRTLPIQTGLFAFLTVWLFATLVAFTDIVANRSAKVTAFLGGQPLPESIISATQKALGVTPVYHEINYLRNGAILAWIAFLFGLISTIISFLAQRRARSAAVANGGFAQAADAEASPVDDVRMSEKKDPATVAQSNA